MVLQKKGGEKNQQFLYFESFGLHNEAEN